MVKMNYILLVSSPRIVHILEVTAEIILIVIIVIPKIIFIVAQAPVPDIVPLEAP